MMKLNWLLFTKAKEEKRRLIEKEKQLATAHLEELARFTSVKEFNEFLVTFKRGVITPTKEGE